MNEPCSYHEDVKKELREIQDIRREMDHRMNLHAVDMAAEKASREEQSKTLFRVIGQLQASIDAIVEELKNTNKAILESTKADIKSLADNSKKDINDVYNRIREIEKGQLTTWKAIALGFIGSLGGALIGFFVSVS